MEDATEELNPLSLLLLPVHRMCLLCARVPDDSDYPYCRHCLETANPILRNPYTGEWEPWRTGPWKPVPEPWEICQCEKCGRFYKEGYLPHCFDIDEISPTPEGRLSPICPDCMVRTQPFLPNGARFAPCRKCRRIWEKWGEYAYRVHWAKQSDSEMGDRSDEIDEDWEKKMEAEFGLDSPSLRSVTKDINSIL